VAAWAVLAGLLILCGEGIKDSTWINSLDQRVTTFVVEHRTPLLTEIMKLVTWTGSWIAVLLVAIAVVVLAWRRRLAPRAVAAVLAVWIGELLAVTLTKSVVQRDRPPEAVRVVVAHGWSFPSGHTANAVVVFATAATLVVSLVDSRAAAVLAWLGASVAVAAVGFSRIELGVHLMTDVVVSVVWAGGWILLAYMALLGRRFAPRAATRTTVGEASGKSASTPGDQSETGMESCGKPQR
jgi:undecaprenyl-diphosphatase